MSENAEEGISISYKSLPSYTLFACAPPEILYHYTSYNGLSGIITSTSLRLTKLSYLNDTNELKLALDMIKNTLEMRAAKSINPTKREFLNKAAHRTESYPNTNICIASFCENGDLLSQWRAYGRNSKSASIGFVASGLEALSKRENLNLWKCVYNKSAQSKLINEFADMAEYLFDSIETTIDIDKWEENQIDLISFFYANFLRVAPVIKDSHFQEEKEWRLISRAISNRHKKYNAMVSNERTSQYFSLDFERNQKGKFDIVNEVTIGPTGDVSLVSGALNVLLNKNEYEWKYLKPSQIPYRET